jgi:protein O-mannosyl-transferase
MAKKRRGAQVDPPRRASPVAAVHRTAFPIWILPILIVAVAAIYYPVWHGGPLWDDDAHLTRMDLRSVHGLWRIWFDVGATQQYYPVVHSVFWLMHRLWGDQTLPYHLTSIALHATSAFLLFLLLRRLGIPGALLAAAVFAVHPIQVESVAWMTELKNTLSGVLYFAAALAYLRFDRERRAGAYIAALVCFLLALFTKTVTGTLPAALLVVFWWQRGRLEGRRDVRPLLPFFLLALAAGVVTAWFERSLLNASGAEYAFTPLQRVVIAGRALWFYLGKLLWPSNLMFIYPRWTVIALSGQLVFPIAAFALLTAFWLIRRRTRAPLAAALLFVGTLFPALGFVNVYPFRYSLVADHFQYLAAAPVFAAIAAALAQAAGRWRSERVEGALICAICIPLAIVSREQSRQYAEATTLYATTLARNPDCWLCHNNLATPLLHGTEDEFQRAAAHITEALRLDPGSAEVRNNHGAALQRMGRLHEALAEHQEALRLNPRLLDARYNVAVVYGALGQTEAAEREYREVLRERPDHPAARHNLGTVLLSTGRIEQGVAELRRAAELDPANAQAHDDVGLALQRAGHPDEAIVAHREAIRLAPSSPTPRYHLGSALLAAGRRDEAVAEFKEVARASPDSAEGRQSLAYVLSQTSGDSAAIDDLVRAVESNPKSAPLHDMLATVLLRSGKSEAAIGRYREAVRLEPQRLEWRYHLALALATSGRPGEAVPEFRAAVGLDPHNAEVRNDLGAALANAGRLDEARAEFEEALRLRPDFPDARANLARVTRR